MDDAGSRGEDALFRRARAGDDGARDQLLERHRGLVRSVARRFFIPSQERDDLVQAGYVGLLRAVDSFDPDRGVAFSTFAVPLLLEEMRAHLHSLGPASVSRRARRLVRQARQFRLRCGGLTLRRVAEELGVDAAEIAHAEEALRPPESLREDLLPAGSPPEPDGAERLDLRGALRDLDCTARHIVLRRYFADRTQREVADELGISQAQVSRRERRALREMRQRLRSTPE